MIGPSEEKDTMDSVEVSRTLIKEEVHLEETVLPCSGEVSQVAVKDEICDEEPPGNKKDDSFTCSEEDINPVDLVHVKLEADDHEDVENEEDAVEGERQNDAEQHDPGLKVEDSFEVVDEESESESLYEGTEEDAVNIDEMNMPTAAFAEEQEDPLKIDDNGTETETFGEDKGNPSRSDKAKTENFPVALVVNVNALKQNRISGASKVSRRRNAWRIGHGSYYQMQDKNSNVIRIGKEVLMRCDVCQDIFRGKIAYKQHVKMHVIEKFSCVSCSEILYSQYDLECHMSDKHKGVNKKYKCPSCPRAYLCYNSMKQHHSLHEMERKFKCNRCQRKFLFISHLNKHLRGHPKLTATKESADNSSMSTVTEVSTGSGKY